MQTVSKHEQVMDQVDLDLGTQFVTFQWAYDDTQDIKLLYVMDKNTWEELGSPSKVTVTVTPGDNLN